MTETSDKFIDRYIKYDYKNPSQKEIDEAKKALHWFTLLEDEPSDQLPYVIEDFFKLDRDVQETVLLFIRGALDADAEMGLKGGREIRS